MLKEYIEITSYNVYFATLITTQSYDNQYLPAGELIVLVGLSKTKVQSFKTIQRCLATTFSTPMATAFYSVVINLPRNKASHFIYPQYLHFIDNIIFIVYSPISELLPYLTFMILVLLYIFYLMTYKVVQNTNASEVVQVFGSCMLPTCSKPYPLAVHLYTLLG